MRTWFRVLRIPFAGPINLDLRDEGESGVWYAIWKTPSERPRVLKGARVLGDDILS